MHLSKTQLYEQVKDLIPKSEFEKEISKRYKESDELFDIDTVALFIVDELGRNKQVQTKIADIKPNSEFTVIGKITNLTDIRTFKRKNGTTGKVLNLDISDETGSCKLVLWNKDIELVKDKIDIGTTVKIINGYTKTGPMGIELNVGRYGLIEIVEEDISIKKEESDEVFGILIKKDPTRAFFRDNGEFGFVTTITIKENDNEKEFTVWNEKVKEIQKFKIGDKISIQNISEKQKNGIKEFHINGYTKIIKS